MNKEDKMQATLTIRISIDTAQTLRAYCQTHGVSMASVFNNALMQYMADVPAQPQPERTQPAKRTPAPQRPMEPAYKPTEPPQPTGKVDMKSIFNKVHNE